MSRVLFDVGRPRLEPLPDPLIIRGLGRDHQETPSPSLGSHVLAAVSDKGAPLESGQRALRIYCFLGPQGREVSCGPKARLE